MRSLETVHSALDAFIFAENEADFDNGLSSALCLDLSQIYEVTSVRTDAAEGAICCAMDERHFHIGHTVTYRVESACEIDKQFLASV